jgi:hypothetical protein
VCAVCECIICCREISLASGLAWLQTQDFFKDADSKKLAKQCLTKIIFRARSARSVPSLELSLCVSTFVCVRVRVCVCVCVRVYSLKKKLCCTFVFSVQSAAERSTELWFSTLSSCFGQLHHTHMGYLRDHYGGLQHFLTTHQKELRSLAPDCLGLKNFLTENRKRADSARQDGGAEECKKTTKEGESTRTHDGGAERKMTRDGKATGGTDKLRSLTCTKLKEHVEPTTPILEVLGLVQESGIVCIAVLRLVTLCVTCSWLSFYILHRRKCKC